MRWTTKYTTSETVKMAKRAKSQWCDTIKREKFELGLIPVEKPAKQLETQPEKTPQNLADLVYKDKEARTNAKKNRDRKYQIEYQRKKRENQRKIME